jgi:hypothetical protein
VLDEADCLLAVTEGHATFIGALVEVLLIIEEVWIRDRSHIGSANGYPLEVISVAASRRPSWEQEVPEAQAVAAHLPDLEEVPVVAAESGLEMSYVVAAA